jgi:hypothetical protein
MHVLDIWYACIDEALLAAAVRSAKRRRAKATSALEQPSESAAHLFPTLATGSDGQPRIVDKPPLVFHPPDDAAFVAEVRATLGTYRRSLATERRALFERFEFADAAYKVVGVGSVGTRCHVALLLAAAGDPLFLQLKEARASVYERYVHSSPFSDHGERVVAGQRLMQATSDVFLGWARAGDGRTYYVRQLRDLKTSADVDHMRSGELNRYGVLCGWALARAHAKAGGEPAMIAGYLGRTGVFDEALVAFARDYAGQNERDYEALLAAVKSGRVVSA